MTENIIETIRGMKDCSMFGEIIDLIGMAPFLSGDGPFTVFVPSNDALEKMTDEDIDKLEGNNNLIRGMVCGHVVLGKLTVEDLRERSALFTMMDDPITIREKEDEVMLNSSTIRSTDIECLNGMVHIIDHPLQPMQVVIMV